MAKYYSKKKYGHERGLSAAFRQWSAESHCRFIHGYSLEFEFVFGLRGHRRAALCGGITLQVSGTADMNTCRIM